MSAASLAFSSSALPLRSDGDCPSPASGGSNDGDDGGSIGDDDSDGGGLRAKPLPSTSSAVTLTSTAFCAPPLSARRKSSCASSRISVLESVPENEELRAPLAFSPLRAAAAAAIAAEVAAAAAAAAAAAGPGSQASRPLLRTRSPASVLSTPLDELVRPATAVNRAWRLYIRESVSDAQLDVLARIGATDSFGAPHAGAVALPAALRGAFPPDMIAALVGFGLIKSDTDVRAE